MYSRDRKYNVCTISRQTRRRRGRVVTLLTQMKWLFNTEARAPSESASE